jgi:hypothetical protein
MKIHATRLSLLALAGAVSAIVIGASARASAPAGRYTVSGGTIYDTRTKLTWQQAPATTTYTWDNAKTYCANSGWRLPRMKELLTIVDYSGGSPAIDQTYFPSTPTGPFWTSSPAQGSATLAWYVDFSSGSAFATLTTSTATYVRCVR